jgi:transitional endoplasmic reticulum ATPase
LASSSTKPVSTAETLEAKLEAMEQSLKPPSETEILRDKILKNLTDLGKDAVSDDALEFRGTKFILPELMKGSLPSAIKYLKEYEQQQETKTGFVRLFPFRPWDGAAAFARAMMRVFGTAGIGKRTYSLFGSTPPRMISVPVGLNKNMQVPWGEISFLPLEASFDLDATGSENGLVFKVQVEAPRKYAGAIEGFFDVVLEELILRSIYRGKAINSSDNPDFIDHMAVLPEQVIYSAEVQEQLQANLWGVLDYAEVMHRLGQSLKRAVLLHGPYGTGKTLAGLLTAQHAVAAGWTFILVRSGEDPFAALKTAKLYAPAVVCIEDLDTIAAASEGGRGKISEILDALDSAQDKQAPVIALFTSNFASDLDKGILRPGRIDSVIRIGELDRNGFERLVKAMIPADLLDPGIDYDAIAEAYADFLPAFASEANSRALMYAISRAGGEPKVLKTEDFASAAIGVRAQLELQNDASESTRTGPKFEAALIEATRAAMADSPLVLHGIGEGVLLPANSNGRN